MSNDFNKYIYMKLELIYKKDGEIGLQCPLQNELKESLIIWETAFICNDNLQLLPVSSH